MVVIGVGIFGCYGRNLAMTMGRKRVRKSSAFCIAPPGFCTAVGQNQRYHFGVGASPILVYFSGAVEMFAGGTIWIFTHGHSEGNEKDPTQWFLPSTGGR